MSFKGVGSWFYTVSANFLLLITCRCILRLLRSFGLMCHFKLIAGVIFFFFLPFQAQQA